MSTRSDKLPIVSRLFSSSVVRELARKGRSPAFARLAAQSHLPDTQSNSALVRDLFDEAFSMMNTQGLRDEYIYKAALTQKVLLGTHSLQTASMLTEFRVGSCKADLAILNGTATVYEVKSDRDSLSRLEKQVEHYLNVFACVYVIAGDQHLGNVLDCVPSDVGVLRLNPRFQISTIRYATDRPERTSSEAIFDCIRTNEAIMILRSLDIQVPDVPNTELYAELRNRFRKLESKLVHDGMVRTLKRTRNLRKLSALLGDLPRSLHTAALSMRLRKVDHARLVRAVNTRLNNAMAWV